MTNQEEFIKLVSENPDLPVIPLVDHEVCAEGWGWWLGSLSCVKKGEIVFYDERWYDDRIAFVEQYYDNHCDELCEKFNFIPDMEYRHNKRGEFTEEAIIKNREAEKELDNYIRTEIADKYFTEAIILYIGLPNPDELNICKD